MHTTSSRISANKYKKEGKHKSRKQGDDSKSSSSSSTNSTISTLEMQNIVNQLQTQQYRNSTMNNYYCVWKKFNQFFIKLDIKPNFWEDRLILFVGYLIQKQ